MSQDPFNSVFRSLTIISEAQLLEIINKQTDQAAFKDLIKVKRLYDLRYRKWKIYGPIVTAGLATGMGIFISVQDVLARMNYGQWAGFFVVISISGYIGGFLGVRSIKEMILLGCFKAVERRQSDGSA